MKVVQGLLCVLTPLIVTGDALSCTSCVSLNACEATCTSNATVQCPSYERCATAYRKTSMNGRDLYDVVRACAPIEKCDLVGSFTFSHSKMTLGVGCCPTDRCTPELLQAPSDGSASNGVRCQSCSSSQATECAASGNISCSGKETKCVAYAQSGSDEASVYQGCGTPSLCEAQHYTTTVMGVTVQHSFTCGTHSVVSGGRAPGMILTAGICVILMNQ